MGTMNNIWVILMDRNLKVEWTYRTSKPEGFGPFPVIILLHGWTGDENSMLVFTSRLPENMLKIAPRGLYPASQGGYAWHMRRDGWPRQEDFDPVVEALHEWLSPAHFPAA